MFNKKMALAALLAVGLSGCVINVQDTDEDSEYQKTRKVQQSNAAYINNLKLGATLPSVRASLGQPDFVETLRKDPAVYEVLFFRTHRIHSDGETTKDECTPLVFRDGVLIGFGDKAYRQL
jgi:hypothetical protein